jgi:transposase
VPAGILLFTISEEIKPQTVTATITEHPAVHCIGVILRSIPTGSWLIRLSQRNIELAWLTGRLMPDFKTTADLRKNNGTAVREVRREFVVLF